MIDPTDENEPTQVSVTTASVPTQAIEPTQVGPPTSQACIPRTVTVTALPATSKLSSIEECTPAVTMTMLRSTPSNCPGLGACASSIPATSPLSEASKRTGLSPYIGVIVFLGILVLVIIGSAIITIRLKKKKARQASENRQSASWWNRTPLGGSLTNLLVKPLNINKDGSKSSQDSKTGFGEYDAEAQRPQNAHLRMKEESMGKERWRDSLSTIQESDFGGSEKGLELQRTKSERRVGRLFDERTRSKYYGTGDI